MTQEDFENGGKPTFRDLYKAVDDLRKEQGANLKDLRNEQKQDLADMEGRLLNAFNNLKDEFRSGIADNAKRIAELDCSGTAALVAHLEATRLEKARNEGRTEVLTWVAKIASFLARHWQVILVVIVALAATIADIDISWIGNH